MKKNISRIIGVIMLIVAIVFIVLALNHPEKSFPWNNTITWLLYGVYFLVTVVLLIAPKMKKWEIPVYWEITENENRNLKFNMKYEIERMETIRSIFLPFWEKWRQNAVSRHRFFITESILSLMVINTFKKIVKSIDSYY